MVEDVAWFVLAFACFMLPSGSFLFWFAEMDEREKMSTLPTFVSEACFYVEVGVGRKF